MTVTYEQYVARYPDCVYLNVPFEDKDHAKACGARWDPQCPDRGSWYVPPERVATGDLTLWQRWLPDCVAHAHMRAAVKAHVQNFPERVYLTVQRSDRERAEKKGAIWDQDCPPHGALYVPAHLTGDLTPWQISWGFLWLPRDVQAGGAATVESDADISKVTVAGEGSGLPKHTFKWMYFHSDGELWRRKRRWNSQSPHVPPTEILTQAEYNRRVEDPMWLEYKYDRDYDDNCHIPDEHGGGSLVIPHGIEIDRAQRWSENDRDGFGWYYDWRPELPRPRSGYRDVDQKVPV